MVSEYLRYWGLERPPFSLTPDPDMLYMSRQHQEGLVRLKYAVMSNKGGALLVSENAGDGKTSLLARLRRELDYQFQGNCRIVFIDHPTLTANQMVGEIARQLGLAAGTTDKLALLNQLRDYLLEQYEQGGKCVVMLDEGQMLAHRPDLLQELRILLNFCVSDSFLLTFIFSGQKPLDEAIRKMPEFYQRLPVRFFLRNLGMEDTRELIRHRLQMAGNNSGREIFSDDGYRGIYNFSKGCPRVICSVADLSLVIAHSRFSHQVDFVSVSQACSDMNRTDGAYHYYHFVKSFDGDELRARPHEREEAPVACPACGGGVLAGARFCQHCGAPMESRSEPEPDNMTPDTGRPGAAEAAETAPLADEQTPVETDEEKDADLPADAGNTEEAADERMQEPPLEPVEQEPDESPVETAGPQEREEGPKTVLCRACDGGIPGDARFCQHCGAEQAVGAAAGEKGEETGQEPVEDRDEPAVSRETGAEESRNLERRKRLEGLKFILDPSQDSDEAATRQSTAPGGEDEENGEDGEKLPETVSTAGPEDTQVEKPGPEKLEEPGQESQLDETDIGPEAPEPEESSRAGEAPAPEEEPGPPEPEETDRQAADPGLVKCSFCGLELAPGVVECPNCGERLDGEDEEEEPYGGAPVDSGAEEDTDEQEADPGSVNRAEVALVEEAERLDLGKYLSLSAESLAGLDDPGRNDRELITFPLRRFLGKSPVVRFNGDNGNGFFTCRCGLSFTTTAVRVMISGGLRKLSYESLEDVRVEGIEAGGNVLLHQLVLKFPDGTYRLLLPLGRAVSEPLCRTLRDYLLEKSGIAAGDEENAGLEDE